MKILGQNFRYGFYDIPPEERIKAIKDAGFDGVMFWWGDEFEDTDGSRYDLYKYAKACGLRVDTVHFPSTHSDWLWREEKRREQVDRLTEAIRDCAERSIENIVMHTTRQLITPPYNEGGIEELLRAVRVAEREGVNIAVENTRFPDYNKYIYDNISSPRLKLCYDCGHEHCYTKGFDVLANFGDKLVTTHIHDNDGLNDDHHLMGEGNIDFKPVFDRLNELGVKYYNLETYCNETSRYFNKISAGDFLKTAHAKLVELIGNSDCDNRS